MDCLLGRHGLYGLKNVAFSFILATCSMDPEPILDQPGFIDSNQSGTSADNYKRELLEYYLQTAGSAQQRAADAKAAVASSIGMGAFGYLASAFKAGWDKSDPTQSTAWRIGHAVAHALTPPGFPAAVRWLSQGVDHTKTMNKLLQASSSPLAMVDNARAISALAPDHIRQPVQQGLSLVRAGMLAHADHQLALNQGETSDPRRIMTQIKDEAYLQASKYLPGISPAHQAVLTENEHLPLAIRGSMAASAALGVSPDDLDSVGYTATQTYNKFKAARALSIAAGADVDMGKRLQQQGEAPDRSYTHHTLALINDAVSNNSDPYTRSKALDGVLQQAHAYVANETGIVNGLSDKYTRTDKSQFPFSAIDPDKYKYAKAFLDDQADPQRALPSFIDANGQPLTSDTISALCSQHADQAKTFMENTLKDQLTKRLDALPTTEYSGVLSELREGYDQGGVDGLLGPALKSTMKTLLEQHPALSAAQHMLEQAKELSRRTALPSDDPQVLQPEDFTKALVAKGLEEAVSRTQSEPLVNTALKVAQRMHEVASSKPSDPSDSIWSRYKDLDRAQLANTLSDHANSALREGTSGFLAAFTNKKQSADDMTKAIFDYKSKLPGARVVVDKDKRQAPEQDPENDQEEYERKGETSIDDAMKARSEGKPVPTVTTTYARRRPANTERDFYDEEVGATADPSDIQSTGSLEEFRAEHLVPDRVSLEPIPAPERPILRNEFVRPPTPPRTDEDVDQDLHAMPGPLRSSDVQQHHMFEHSSSKIRPEEEEEEEEEQPISGHELPEPIRPAKSFSERIQELAQTTHSALTSRFEAIRSRFRPTVVSATHALYDPMHDDGEFEDRLHEQSFETIRLDNAGDKPVGTNKAPVLARPAIGSPEISAGRKRPPDDDDDNSMRQPQPSNQQDKSLPSLSDTNAQLHQARAMAGVQQAMGSDIHTNGGADTNQNGLTITSSASLPRAPSPVHPILKEPPPPPISAPPDQRVPSPPVEAHGGIEMTSMANTRPAVPSPPPTDQPSATEMSSAAPLQAANPSDTGINTTTGED